MDYDLLEESNKLSAQALAEYDLAYIMFDYDEGKYNNVLTHLVSARELMSRSEKLFKEWQEQNEKP